MAEQLSLFRGDEAADDTRQRGGTSMPPAADGGWRRMNKEQAMIDRGGHVRLLPTKELAATASDEATSID